MRGAVISGDFSDSEILGVRFTFSKNLLKSVGCGIARGAVINNSPVYPKNFYTKVHYSPKFSACGGQNNIYEELPQKK